MNKEEKVKLTDEELKGIAGGGNPTIRDITVDPHHIFKNICEICGKPLPDGKCLRCNNNI